MHSRTGWFCSLLMVGVLLTTGCDDIILFDVSSTGELLVAADARGRSGLVGNSKSKRHLFWVDPELGSVERLTRKPLKLAWPTANGRSALYVTGRKRLIHHTALKQRTLYVSKQTLLQPLVSPTGDRIAVLEATKLGVSGTLLVLEASSGKVLHRVERALLGATWSTAGLFVPRSKAERTEAFKTSAGEIVRVDPQTYATTPIFRTRSFPAVTRLAQAKTDLISVLHVSGAKKALGLARLTLGRRGATRGEQGSFDFWPTPSPDGKKLLFTRSGADKPTVQAQLRLTTTAGLTRSSAVPTPGIVASPRWVGADRIAFLTADDRLLIQDLDGENRIDLTATLRTAYARRAEEKTK